MDLVTGDLLWTRVNKVPKKYTYLSTDIECDVVVVGGGITGALCAYHFAEADVSTVLVDKNIIGYGSTSASTSILQYEIDTDLTGLSNQIGIEQAVKCFKMTEQAVYDIEALVKRLDDTCGFALRECFYYTDKENDVWGLRREFDLREKHGFDVEFLDRSSAKERFSFPVKGGIYSRRGAGEIDPYRFAHALISAAEQKGLEVFENTEVVEFKSEGPYVVLRTQNGFRIRAKKAIIATGFEAKRMIRKKTANMSRSFTIVTKPVEAFEGWYNRCIIRDMGDPYTYLRTTSEGRIMIGGEDLAIGGYLSKMSRLTNEDRASKDKFGILFERLREMFPEIRFLEVEYQFSGLFGDTKDGLPFIGEYEGMPNCWFCLGYGSNGILYGVMGARMLRDWYLGGRGEDVGVFGIGR